MIRKRAIRWMELDGEWSSPPVRVEFETVDLGDGADAVPAVRIGSPRSPTLGQLGGQIGGSNLPTQYLVRVSDLKALVELAEESSEDPGFSG